MKRFFVFTCLAIVLFQSCKEETVSPASGLIAYTPRNANVVIKINDYQAFKSELINNNFIKLLKNTPAYKNTFGLLNALKYITPKGTSLLTFTEIGKNEFNYTLICKNHNDLFSIDSTVNRKVEEIKYEGASIKVLSIGEKQIFSTSVNNYFIGSSSRLLIENLIRNTGNLKADKNLEKLYQVAQNNIAANIFINHKESANLFQNVLSKNLSNNMVEFNDWTSVDASIAQDYIKLNGIATSSDSIPNTLNLFKHKSPASSHAAEIVPLNASFFIAYPAVNPYNLRTVQPKDSLFKNIEEFVEIGLNQVKVAAVKNNDNIDFEDKLQQFVKQKSTYRDQTVWELNTDDLLVTHLTKIAKHIKAAHVAKVGDYYVFAQNSALLEGIISNFQNNATLAQVSTYTNLRSELADESSVLAIANLEKIKDSGSILNPDFITGIAKTSFKDYKYAAFQYISEGNFAHFHVLLKKANTSTVNSNLVTQLYSTTLDADIVSKPQFVLNHYTKKMEIVVQDNENNLYLIATNGKVLWKKKLDSKIRGNISQVDLYRNGRLQLAFTTATKFMVVDRNGEDVSPFPLSFNSTITQPLAVFDYSNNRDYRFLIVMGKQIKMYDRNAETVNGFTLKETNNTLINSPKHIRIGNKDYIVLQENDGKLDILHRTGDVRVRVKGNIDFSGNEIYLYNGKFTTTNTNGDLIQVDQQGRLNKIALDLKENHLIDATAHTLSTISENMLNIKENKATLDFGIYTQPKIFYIYDKIYVSVTDKQTHKVYLFDSNAKMIENFPVYGDAAVDLADMDNDKKLEMITVGDKNSVICYKIN
ncbi:ribonuclease HII [Galbibacter sp. PAP.153]|uniref:ribonuclease HII n=1 Tax=Galbibacter sp. PAP.153 TaxID=3104623 RepID=UPI00300BCA13